MTATHFACYFSRPNPIQESGTIAGVRSSGGRDANDAIAAIARRGHCRGIVGNGPGSDSDRREATPSPDSLATYVGLFADEEGPTADLTSRLVRMDLSGSPIWRPTRFTSSTPTGKLIRSFGETGQGDGQFEFADFGAVGLDGDGNVYVLDTGNQRVQKFTPDLTFMIEWGKIGSGERRIRASIRHRRTEKDGTSFVIDALSGRLQQFDSSGAVHAGHRPHRSGGRVLRAWAAGLDSDGNLYVPDLTRIYVFDSTGHQIRAIQTNEIDNGEVWVGNGAAVSESGSALCVGLASQPNRRVRCRTMNSSATWVVPGRDPVNLARSTRW